jgi:[ribosomal protein S18]-alanine N-acetyltransferase
MPVTIRSASLDDVPALLAIEREAPSAAHWTAEQYARLVESGVVLVSEESQRITGFVCANIVAGDWEIENLVVDQQNRRRGIGDALLGELLRSPKIEAGSAVWLEVRESNQAARCLYEKHGFREPGRRGGYYRTPDEDGVLYDYRLESK